MSLRVIHPGVASFLVDSGRPRFRSLGIGLGGAADLGSWRIANGLVGNLSTALALEIALSGPTLVAEKDVTLGFFGNPFHLVCNESPLPLSSTFRLRRGQTVRIGSTPSGVRGYLSVCGGFHSRQVLESESSFFPIQPGELLECDSITFPIRALGATNLMDLLESDRDGDSIHVLPGPQFDWFQINDFLAQTFKVSASSNRMGIRLEGVPIARLNRELISEAVAPGAIQITNEGLPIILGVDGQTIGGYPKIAHIIRRDLDLLGQLRPGQTIRFQLVELNEAERLYRQYRMKLHHWSMRLQVADGIPSSFVGKN